MIKMVIINIDGVKVKVQSPDLDGDGEVGGVEFVSKDIGTTPINQSTELGDTLKELNKDVVDTENRMSGIDMRARLHPLEISSILALDALVALKVMPTSCLAFSRQKKRLSVSLEGKGRDDIVNIVAGKRELDAKAGMGGFMDKAKGFLGMGGNEQPPATK